MSRLPDSGYRDNPTAQALVSWVDESLAAKAAQMQNLYKDLCDPATCRPEFLEYLAYLVGLSGAYWDIQWDTEVKRTLIKNAHSKLWRLRGTFHVIAFVLDTHRIRHLLWTDGESVLSFRMPKTFGSAKLRFYLRLPIDYHRNGLEFREAQRTLRNYAPAIVEHKAVYEQFFCGFSKLGEPMFNRTR